MNPYICKIEVQENGLKLLRTLIIVNINQIVAVDAEIVTHYWHNHIWYLCAGDSLLCGSEKRLNYNIRGVCGEKVNWPDSGNRFSVQVRYLSANLVSLWKSPWFVPKAPSSFVRSKYLNICIYKLYIYIYHVYLNTLEVTKSYT